MGAEPEAADFALAQEHSDAESDVRRLQYEIQCVLALQLAPLQKQLGQARARLARLEPAYREMLDRLGPEEETH